MADRGVSATLLRDVEDIGRVALRAAVDIAAANMLVRDYWLTEALRAIVATHGESVVFKGGTSLTKALRVVDRFSEDLDLLVITRGSIAVRERMLTGMRDAVLEVLGLEAAEQASRRGERREVVIRIPADGPIELSPTFRLEMGIRGADLPPAQLLPVEPLLAAELARAGEDTSRFADLVPFAALVLHPARTLWEKLMLLHVSASKGDRTDPELLRIARHYGDVGALLVQPDVRATLSDHSVRAATDTSVREVTARWFGGEPPAPPPGGYATSPAFRPGPAEARRLRRAYDRTLDLLWAPDGRLTFEEVLERVERSAELLNPT